MVGYRDLRIPSPHWFGVQGMSPTQAASHPPGLLLGSECSPCRLHRLHPAPSETLLGSECRVCRQQRLHLEPDEAAGGSECRVCRQQRLHPIHMASRLVPLAGCVVYTDCISCHASPRLVSDAASVADTGCISSTGRANWFQMQLVQGMWVTFRGV